MKKRRPPQEKKAHSYAKDRRNRYGESVQGAKKSIPRNKRIVNGKFRRKSKQAIKAGDLSPDQVEVEVEKVIRGKWQKAADVPLGEVVKAKQERRIRDHGARKRRLEERQKRDAELKAKIDEVAARKEYSGASPEKISRVALHEIVEGIKARLREMGRL